MFKLGRAAHLLERMPAQVSRALKGSRMPSSTLIPFLEGLGSLINPKP